MARRFTILATEANALLKKYGEALAKKITTDSSIPMLQHEINEAPGDTMHEKTVNHIIKHSPHPKYNKWLVHNYAHGGIQKMDDMDKAKEGLSIFHKHIAKMPTKDIYQVKGLKHLQDITEPHAEAKTRSEQRAENTEGMEKERSLIYDGPHYRVVMPHTQRASIHYGKNTRWCTAAEHSRNYFDEYHPSGNLFYFLPKGEGKKHAIFVPHKDMKNGDFQAPEGFDAEDTAMHPRKIMEKYDDAADAMSHVVPSMLHRVHMHIPKPDKDYAPSKEELAKVVPPSKRKKVSRSNDFDDDED